MVELLSCLLPKVRPRLFRIFPNSKVCCINLEADQVAFLLQFRAALPIEIEHIFRPDGELFPEILFSLVQLNCYGYDVSVEPSIFVVVITMPTLRRIRLEVCNYEFSFRHLSVF